jgi:hypothetical protein
MCSKVRTNGPNKEEISKKSIVKDLLKEVIMSKLIQACAAMNLNNAW